MGRDAWQARASVPHLTRIEVPETPPSEWFSKPDWLEPGQKLTVLANGQAAGYWFQHGTCLVHDPTACPKPDPTGYRMFAQNGDIDGTPVGVIGNVHGHASPNATVQQAMAHYSDPDAAMLIGACGDDEHGAWFAGCLIPDKDWTGRDVAFLNRCALSGDWRPLPYDSPWWTQNGVAREAVMAAEGYSSLGPTLVTRPALPLVRSYAMAASADDRPVLLGGLGGIQLDEYAPCNCQETQVAATTDTTNTANTEERPETVPPEVQALIAEQNARVESALAKVEELTGRLDASTQAELDAKAAEVESVDLPPPNGFDERTSALTDADRDWIARTAAGK